MNDRRRPNPEELLEAVQKLETKEKRGHLRVFFGMCPGVGKTYAMLKAAQEEKIRGTRILVGVVETHGRKETEAVLAGLTVLPRMQLKYKHTELQEMDLDGILRDRPDIVLVDELAHSNAPGSRHLKRYQDVEEILQAGIDVYTTLNIQHIESRNDQVAQITGVIVQETVPDSFIELADQMEVVDLSPNELLRRLKEGKVYLGDRAEQAAANFFKEEHLTALRELALRFTAEKVDQDLQDQMTVKGIEGPWNTAERLMVAVSHSPSSARLIRATRRMAVSLEAPWVALHVDTGETLSHDDQENLKKNLALSRELGAEVIATAESSVAEAIQRISAEKNVTQIILGRPDKRFFRDWMTRGTLLDQLVRSTSQLDVHVIRADRMPTYKGFHLRMPEAKSGWVSYYYTAWFLIAVTILCRVLMPYTGYQALGSIYILAILLMATVGTRGPLLLAAFMSAIAWDFFFIPPSGSFTISKKEDVMMCLTFFLIAIVGGLLTTRIRRQEEVLQSREKRARLLYELGKSLSKAKTSEAMANILIGAVDSQFGSESHFILTDRSGHLQTENLQAIKDVKTLAVATWAFENSKPAGWSTTTLSASKCLCYPMRSTSGTLGVLLMFPPRKSKALNVDQFHFLATVTNQAALAIEGLRISEIAGDARLAESSEKLHQTLINSVSHELRTPITAIIGAASALNSEQTIQDRGARESLTNELVRSARRLDRVVENLLDISRLEKHGLQLKKEWFPFRELVEATKSYLKTELSSRQINVQGNQDLLLEGDFQLLIHALANLVLNAHRYSPPEQSIELSIRQYQNQFFIGVKDHGIGIPAGQEKLIFEKFYRVPGTPAGGLGLGLSIVKNVMELHEGTVRAYNNERGSGATFELSLPEKPVPAELKEYQ